MQSHSPNSTTRFTAFYSGIPEHEEPFRYLFTGLDGHNNLVPWMWTSAVLAVGALAALIYPRARQNETILAVACVAVFISLWIEKGLGLAVTGFIPSPLGAVTEYFLRIPAGNCRYSWCLGSGAIDSNHALPDISSCAPREEVIRN